MTTNNNKYIIINEIVWIKQLLFVNATFLSLSKLSLVFNISPSHSNANLPIRLFSQDKCLISRHSSILHALLHSQSHVLGFHV